MRSLTIEEKKKLIDCFGSVEDKKIDVNSKQFEDMFSHMDEQVIKNWTTFLDATCNKFLDDNDADEYDTWFESLSEDSPELLAFSKIYDVSSKDIQKYRIEIYKKNCKVLAEKFVKLGTDFINEIKSNTLPLHATFYFGSGRNCEYIIFLPEEAANLSKNDLKECLARGNRIYRKLCNDLQEALKEFNANQSSDDVHIKLSTSTYSKLSTESKMDTSCSSPFTDNSVIWEKEAGIDDLVGIYYSDKRFVPVELRNILFESVPSILINARKESYADDYNNVGVSPESF